MATHVAPRPPEVFQREKLVVNVPPRVLESAKVLFKNQAPEAPVRNQSEIQAPVAANISAIDWMLMASLRNQSADLNPFGDYETPADQWSAITLPSNLKTWFNAVGAETRFDNTTLFGVFKPGWTGLQRLSTDAPYNHVILLVSANIFTDQNAGTKNHWVVLNDRISVNGQPMNALNEKSVNIQTATIETNIFTWGFRNFQKTEMKNQPISLSKFLSCCYGGVSFSPIP